MPKNTGWTTTSVPTDLAERIESFVNSKEGKKLGYTSKTGFIADALREKLDELTGESKKQQTKLEDKMNEMNNEIITIQKMLIEKLENNITKKTKSFKSSHFQVISKENDHFILKDNIKNKIADVAIQKGELFCQLCEENNCVHVGFVFSLPDVYEKLEKKLTKTV